MLTDGKFVFLREIELDLKWRRWFGDGGENFQRLFCTDREIFVLKVFVKEKNLIMSIYVAIVEISMQ